MSLTEVAELHGVQSPEQVPIVDLENHSACTLAMVDAVMLLALV